MMKKNKYIKWKTAEYKRRTRTFLIDNNNTWIFRFSSSLGPQYRSPQTSLEILVFPLVDCLDSTALQEIWCRKNSSLNNSYWKNSVIYADVSKELTHKSKHCYLRWLAHLASPYRLSIQRRETLLVRAPPQLVISRKATSWESRMPDQMREQAFIRLCGEELVRVIQPCGWETWDWKSEVRISKCRPHQW